MYQGMIFSAEAEYKFDEKWRNDGMESLFFEILNIKDLYHNTNNIITLKKDNTNVKNFTF